MPRAITILPLDKSGRDPTNLSRYELAELHESELGLRIAILEHGGFYENNLKVFDKDGNDLIRNHDYILGYYHPKVSAEYGLDIFSAIVVLNPDVKDHIHVNAQMVGSDVAFSFTVVDSYAIFLHYREDQDPSTLTDKEYHGPEPIWCPGQLKERRWQLDTYQPFNIAIYELSRNITGSAGSYEEDFRQYIRDSFDRFVGEMDILMTEHINNMNNPHELTKAQMGLGNVENYPVATLEETMAGTSDEHYLTPYLTWKYLEANSFDDLNEHVNDFNNPHNTTIEDVNGVPKPIIDEMYKKKYFITETVVGSNRGEFNGTKAYNSIVNEFRTNIPAQNFTSGILDKARWGSGHANGNNVLLSNPLRWYNWNDLVTSLMGRPGTAYRAYPNATAMDLSTPNTIINSSTWRSIPLKSIVFFSLAINSKIIGDSQSKTVPGIVTRMSYSGAVYRDTNSYWYSAPGDGSYM